jgi:hypothetical protein
MCGLDVNHRWISSGFWTACNTRIKCLLCQLDKTLDRLLHCLSVFDHFGANMEEMEPGRQVRTKQNQLLQQLLVSQPQ